MGMGGGFDFHMSRDPRGHRVVKVAGHQVTRKVSTPQSQSSPLSLPHPAMPVM